jgi:hypothetical protein
MRPLFSVFRSDFVPAAIFVSFAVVLPAPARAAMPLSQNSASLVLNTNDAVPVFGQSIKLTATLTVVNGTAPRSGTYAIFDGSSALVTGAAINTLTSFVYSTSSLAVGRHTLVAKYTALMNAFTVTSNRILVDVRPVSGGLPSISQLKPASASAGGGSITLTVIGAAFRANSVVKWNGTPVPTSYVNATELRASISSSDITTAGLAGVIVVNPTQKNGTSAPADFTIKGALAADERFVSPSGSDTNPGAIAQPYRTIQKCATTVVSGGTCQVRAGTYRETVTPNSGITITSYDGEEVTVDGSNPVTGWTLYKGHIYQAKVTLSSGDTNQVFAGDQMMTEARWPNGDDLFHVNWATAEAGTNDTTLVDSHLPGINWKGAKIHFLSGTDPYSPETATVTASASGQLQFTLDDVENPPNITPQPDGYYYLYRSLNALDAQREWFYDSTTNTLYLWAPGGVDPNTLHIRAKLRQDAFDLSGRSGATIERLNLFAAKINMDSSSSDNTLDSIYAQYVSHYTDLPSQSVLEPGASEFGWQDHNDDTGIILNGSGNLLENSIVGWSAGNGVTLMGSDNAARNNLVYNTGYTGNDATGISLFGTNHAVQKNTVHTSGRYAVTINSYPVNPDNDDLSFNNLFNAMMLGRDGGEVYSGEATTNSTRIHHNWIHDTQSPFGGPLAGVYLDEEASGFEADQNVLWNNEYFDIFLHGSSHGATTAMNDNIHNNSIPDVGADAYIWLMGVLNCGTTRIADNLVLEPISQQGTDPACSASDNNSTAPGATEMNASVQVGCDFAGCGSEGPPKISGNKIGASIAVQPLSQTVTVGAKATFAVTAAGSSPIHYQWKRDGVIISGATSATYTTPKVSAADNGAAFSVDVSNSVGSATSTPALLTVN